MQFIATEGVVNCVTSVHGKDTSVGTIVLNEGRHLFKGNSTLLPTGDLAAISAEMSRLNNLLHYGGK